MLFSSKRRGRPGPKGPAEELIDAVVEMKRRNPTWGCPRGRDQKEVQGPGLIQAIEKLVPSADSADGVAFTIPPVVSIVMASRFWLNAANPIGPVEPPTVAKQVLVCPV
jgi:hypothetical protein